MPPRVINIPAVRPVHPSHHPHHHPPFWGSGFGGGFGGCFNNGFTSVCGANPYFYGGYGSNYCFSGIGFWNCGYGGGYGLGYYGGYGYAPGQGSDYDMSGSAVEGAYDSQNESGNLEVYGGYIGGGAENTEQNPATETPQKPLPQIILKNGSAYEVTSYWVSNGELYYRPVTGGLNHVPVDQLDLSATVEANSRNGLTFELKDHPPEQ